MNVKTYQIYEGDEAIAAAKARGEKIIELAPGIARALTLGEDVVQVTPRDIEQINRAALHQHKLTQISSSLPIRTCGDAHF